MLEVEIGKKIVELIKNEEEQGHLTPYQILKILNEVQASYFEYLKQKGTIC